MTANRWSPLRFWDNHPVLATAIVVSVVLFFILLDQSHWDDYVAAHHCKVTQRESGMYYGDNYVPGRTTYACDDGETVIR